MPSCATRKSCNLCNRLPHGKLAEAESIACYAEGCSCYGETVYTEALCVGPRIDDVQRRNYLDCEPPMNTVVMPRDALIAMTVYDFDMGTDGNYREQFTIDRYEYYVTPLRPTKGPFTGDAVNSSVHYNPDTHTFTATARALVQNGGESNYWWTTPDGPRELNSDQPSRGVQFFVRCSCP